MRRLWSAVILALGANGLFACLWALRRPTRKQKLPLHQERVLILGASSGIGEALAYLYAARGARVCVVGRRQAKVDNVVQACDADNSGRVIGVSADFADVDDMTRLRAILENEWQGVDTVVVSAGVSALRPLMAVAGVQMDDGATLEDATPDGIKHTVDVASAALRGNYIGPLVAAVTFIPLLTRTSKAPAVLLVNSLASVIPAPTRALYASTKSASLLLYQSLAIEHSNIAFTHFLPSTVEGDFRASAVDGGPVMESDPNKYGLKRGDVARRCISAIDHSEKNVFMPCTMFFAHLLYWLYPSYIESVASAKYNYD